MSPKIFLSYRRDDTSAAAGHLREQLIDRFGPDAVFDVEHSIAPGGDFQQTVSQAVRRSDSVLVLIGPEWLSSMDAMGGRRLDDPHDFVRREVALALVGGKRVIPVLLDGAQMPPASVLPDELRALAGRQAIQIDARHFERDIADLIDRLTPTTAATPMAARRSTLGGAGNAVRILTGAVAGAAASVLAGLKGVFTTTWHTRQAPPSTEAPQPEESLPVPAGTAPHDPVLLGVTAPPSCQPGARFNAVLAAYVASARASTEAKLKRLGGQGTMPLLDFAPDRQVGWKVGAPVSVRLTATHADIAPTEREFEWSGRENLAPFDVRIHPDAQGVELDLCFHLALAGVPIACIPLPVTLTSKAPAPAEPTIKSVRTADTAFASYSSKDAQTVGYCLSALTRWSPGLAIFQDCLDLDPNESFKPQLSQRITSSDVFLLFWSRNASASPWVHWEYDTARLAKGLDAVIPMPLEDPKIAPPPPEFADAHMRDRFMVARYALAKIDEAAAAGHG